MNNRLAKEKSPYLLQHKNNPVDWYPWSQEAFDTAKKENKPIFLSIGYSTCHWCHVMERESFEDPEVAELLKRHFVAIKVDREERPDIDHIYMSVCQGLTGHGGWPLTIVMTPGQKPFFAGTYFPKRSRQGMPGLMDVLAQLAEKWAAQQEDLTQAGRQILDAVQRQVMAVSPGELTRSTLDEAYSQLEQNFDSAYGGFGRAPKFPTPHNLALLLRRAKQDNRPQALKMVEKTLDSMAAGGIYDHVGFGFARYSTDRKWLVPHFEKMLYDNALLAWVLLETYEVTKNQRYARVAEEIFTYVLRDMTSPEGGFYSAEDADSEGQEGKFYIWTPAEVKSLLGDELGGLYCTCYDITERGNFEGKNIPNLIDSGIDQSARRFGLSKASLQEKLGQAREKLWQEREKRIHPHKDDKILTAWNGLMIAALAKGAQVLGKPAYSHAAERAARFILEKLVRKDGRLLARYREGQAAFPAYVDDYAFLIWGLIELYEASFAVDYLRQALKLSQDLLRYFWDDKEGGLFIYGSDSEQLAARPKEVYDGATPVGNSVSALNFLRLSRLTGQPDLEDYAHRIFRAFAGNVNNYPAGHTFMLLALWFALTPGKEIVIAGDRKDKTTGRMLAVVRDEFRPESVVMWYNRELAELAPAFAEQKPLDNRAVAYVCENFACHTPVTQPEDLQALLVYGLA